MILKEIILGKNDKERREMMEKLIGNEVIIEDEHLLWQHGKILNANNTRRYEIELYNARGKTEMWYNDILQLIEVYKYPTPNLQID